MENRGFTKVKSDGVMRFRGLILAAIDEGQS